MLDLYYYTWTDKGTNPQTTFVAAESPEKADFLFTSLMATKGERPNDRRSHKLQGAVGASEVHAINTLEVEKEIEDGLNVPYCPCGNALCFDDEFCSKCGNRLDWRKFWE